MHSPVQPASSHTISDTLSEEPAARQHMTYPSNVLPDNVLSGNKSPSAVLASDIHGS